MRRLIILTVVLIAALSEASTAIDDSNRVLCFVDLADPTVKSGTISEQVIFMSSELIIASIRFKNLSGDRSAFVPTESNSITQFVKLKLIEIGSNEEVELSPLGREALSEWGTYEGEPTLETEKSWSHLAPGCSRSFRLPVSKYFQMPKSGHFRLLYEFTGISGGGDLYRGEGCAAVFELASKDKDKDRERARPD